MSDTDAEEQLFNNIQQIQQTNPSYKPEVVVRKQVITKQNIIDKDI